MVYSPLENCLVISLKVKHKLYHPVILFLEFTQENCKHVTKDLTMNLIAALFIITPKWKQSKCPSIDECASKMHCVHTVEYYSAIKIMLKQRNQSQKTTYSMIPFM